MREERAFAIGETHWYKRPHPKQKTKNKSTRSQGQFTHHGGRFSGGVSMLGIDGKEPAPKRRSDAGR